MVRLCSCVARILIALGASAAALLPCDTWVALKDATADGSVILAKNSDRPSMEAQPLVQIARAKHPPGAMVKCTYLEIPQVRETNEIILSKIWWAFGGEHGMNEHGVAIGNEAVWSKEPYQWNDGLLGMDLLRLGLERGKTAYEAMHVMAGLLEKYGQSGDCERPGEWGKANYHNSFLIADPNEAWVFETAGRYWAAKRLARGVFSISNIYSIENDWDEASPDLVRHAVEKGWTKSAADFNFARDYGDYWTDTSKNPGDMQLRRNATYGCLKRDYSRITPATMMKINREHHEGTIAEPRWSAAETFWASPCMHDNSRRRAHSAASIVAHLRAQMPPLLRQVYWASFSNPCSNVFKPFYLHGVRVPSNYAQGTSTYSPDSPWWSAHRLKLICDLNHEAVNPAVRAVFDQTERWEFSRQRAVEAQALKLAETGRGSEAAAILQGYVDENCARVAQQYPALSRSAEDLVKTLGVKYLFVGFLKDWTGKSKVPLPLP